MRAWISADMKDMSALGFLAVVALLGFGGAGHPGPPPGQGAPPVGSHQCSFTTSAGARQQGGDSPGPGNLTVAIPPVAIVRVDGRRLVVTTNTGERPRAGDSVYVVAAGKAEPAGARLRQEVLSACGTGRSISAGPEGPRGRVAHTE
jgi:hypothetical protein